MRLICLAVVAILFRLPVPSIATTGLVDVTEYGADGTDTQPDDVAIEKAIKVALTKNLPLYFPAGTFRITRTIVLDFHNKNVGIVGDGMHATIIEIDEGRWKPEDKVAIYSRTCAATFRDFSLTGSRKIKLNGILFNFYGGHGTHRNIKVNHFNGFGVKYVAIWDAYVENLIIENCGSQQEWAFSVHGGHDTSNHTTFNRLQVELAHDKAMYVDASSLNLVFIGIHSERLIRESSSSQDVSHHLRGGSCSYLNARIENTKSVSRILLGNASGSYTDFRCGGQIVEVSYGARTSQQINNLVCRSLIIPADNLSQVLFENAHVSGTVAIRRQIENYPTFKNCTFRGPIENSGNASKAVFVDCNVKDTQSLARAKGINIVRSSF